MPSVSGLSTDSLVDLGFTPVEAEVYLFLLQESPATGYRVSQDLGRPPSQIYRALEALERKGGVLAHGGEGRRYRPVQIQELVAKLQRDFDRRKARAVEAVETLPAPTSDELVYRLQSRTQLFQRCSSMLDRCRHVAILDLFPAAVEPLRKPIAAATDRGVATIVKVYQEVDLKPTVLTMGLNADTVLRRWPGQQVTIASDAREFVAARLSRSGDEVDSAFWSENSSLAASVYNGKLCEVGFVVLHKLIASGAPRARLLAAADDVLQYALTRNLHLLAETKSEDEAKKAG